VQVHAIHVVNRKKSIPRIHGHAASQAADLARRRLGFGSSVPSAADAEEAAFAFAFGCGKLFRSDF
jgi:hypothetical protein